MIFRDRTDAGLRLADALQQYRGQDVIVYALPRGGVVLGTEVARSLEAPLDLIVVRKIGHPDNPEYAIAAVSDDGHLRRNVLETIAIDKAWFDEARRAEQVEACRRRDLYLAGRAPLKADGKIAILVDDGLATGLSMALAIGEVRHRRPSKVVVAVPVAPLETIEELREAVDNIVVLHVPDHGFQAIGDFYVDFPQLSDAEVVAFMSTGSMLK
jgi:predicted phosphoribosyltransferase